LTESRRRAIVGFVDSRLGVSCKSEEQKALTCSGDEAVEVETGSGKGLAIRVSEIKAIFLVRSLEGSRDYSELKLFSSPPTGEGV